MVLFKINLSSKFSAYTYLFNIPLYVDLLCFNVPHHQNVMQYYFMGSRGHEIIKSQKMDKYRKVGRG